MKIGHVERGNAVFTTSLFSVLCKVIIFSLRQMRTGSLKPKNQVKSKKRLSRSQISSFPPKIKSEDQKNVFTFLGRSVAGPELKLPKIFVFLQQIKIKHIFTVQNAKEENI